MRVIILIYKTGPDQKHPNGVGVVVGKILGEKIAVPVWLLGSVEYAVAFFILNKLTGFKKRFWLKMVKTTFGHFKLQSFYVRIKL